MSTLLSTDGLGADPVSADLRVALLAAYARACESRRSDALFCDFLAESFVANATRTRTGLGATLPQLAPARDGRSAIWTSMYAYLAGRTPFADRFLTQAVALGGRQVVILGAGLDTRAYRLPLEAGTTVYEVDMPATLRFKDGVLARHDQPANVQRVVVASGLEEDWPAALRRAGFTPGRPTVWLVEGLLTMLTGPQAQTLMRALTAASAPGSVLAGEYLNRSIRLEDLVALGTHRSDADSLAHLSRGGPGLEPEVWLPQHGWQVRQLDLTDELAALGRPVPGLLEPGSKHPLRSLLFTAVLSGSVSVARSTGTAVEDGHVTSMRRRGSRLSRRAA